LAAGTAPSDQDLFSVGPVVVVEVTADVERHLGGADRVHDVFMKWPQLCTLETGSVCTWVGNFNDLEDEQPENVRLAPPEHWTDSSIRSGQLNLPVNDELLSLALHGLDW